MALSLLSPAPGEAKVIRVQATAVLDGDTIRVRSHGRGGDTDTVQLLGIDAPERGECGGRQATSNMLELTFTSPSDSDGDHFFDTPGGTGRRLTLETDPTQRPRDRSGRLLAYVRTVAGKQLQLDQLIRGWARVHPSKPLFRRYVAFRRAQSDARAVSHGVWSKCGGDFHRPV